MDPTACWKRYLAALIEGDADEANAALFDLRVWLNRGGAPPEGFTFDEICALAITLSPVRHAF